MSTDVEGFTISSCGTLGSTGQDRGVFAIVKIRDEEVKVGNDTFLSTYGL